MLMYLTTAKKKISFIIPLFNGEKFIKKCLDSLLSQDIPKQEYEIICIDDCSKDNSVKIVEDYCVLYSNIILIQHQNNLKTGSTCNTGVRNAQGEYIWIIGQDDWIVKNCLSKLFKLCTENRLDVLAFNYNRVDECENELHAAQVFKDDFIHKGDTYIINNFKNTFPDYLLGYEWRAIFRKDYLKQNNISFTEGAIYEDTTYLFKAILFSKRFMSISDFIYNYRVNSLSITDTNKKYYGHLLYEFAFVAGKEVLDLSESIKNDYVFFSNILATKAVWYFQSFTYKIIPASNKEKKVFYRLIKENNLLVKQMLTNTAWYIKILADPNFGLLFSTILKPIYLLKRKIKNFKKPRQEWSY